MWKDVSDYSAYLSTFDKPLLKLENKQLAKKNLIKPCTYTLPVEHIWTLEPVRAPADMKGLRLRAAGPSEIKTCEALGASAVMMPSSEAYMALQRGTVDGVYCYPGTVGARKLDELVKYVNMATFAAYGHEPYFRLDYWNSLPKDVKDILIEEFTWLGEIAPEYTSKVHNEQYWPRFEKAGVVKIEPTPAELAAFRTAANSVYDWWKGLVGESFYNEYMSLAGK
jgi:TRAP-type C4-dicarboxylate transport system, periplasmic component